MDGPFSKTSALSSLQDVYKRQICHQLQVCENLLKSIGLAGAAAIFAAAVRYAPYSVIPSCAELVRTFTLVSLKVKLSD